ncbi:MAG: CYTH domain-containing protein [Longicatena sp.]
MNINIEKEYKVLLNEEQFDLLVKQQDNLLFVEQINTYYDTLQHDLRNCHGVLRIREKNNSYLFTMKLHSDEGLQEFECNVPNNSIDVFEQPDIKALLQHHNFNAPFKKITTLLTKRAVVDSPYAEICFDENFYNGKHDYEIEYEYKSDHDGLTIFQNILKPIGITYKDNCLSKFKRAMDSL